MRLTRRRLYLWLDKHPATTIANELGISSSALKKTCKVHGIPTPSRGHWRKREVGETSVQQPLPDPDQDDELPYEISAETAVMLDRLEEAVEWKAESAEAISTIEIAGDAGQRVGEKPAEPRSPSGRRVNEPSFRPRAAPAHQRPSSNALPLNLQALVNLARRHRELGDALSFLRSLEAELPSYDRTTQAYGRLWIECAKASLSRVCPLSEVLSNCREVAHGSAMPTWWEMRPQDPTVKEDA